jgi:hypothetical protein
VGALIPTLDQNGYLPPGVHLATIEEVETTFGRQSELRRVQMESIRWLLDASKHAGILRIVIDGSFATDRLEPNDVDCALMAGPETTPDRKTEVEALEEIPFLHVLILDAPAFDRAIDDIFGTDRRGISKGMIEVTSWN